MTISHFKITSASLISAFTFAVGQVVAFVPQFGPDKQNLISAGSAVIAAVFLVSNAIHSLASSKLSAKDLEGDIGGLVQTEVGRVDFNSFISQAVAAHGIAGFEGVVAGQVQAELRRIFAAQAPAAPAQPMVPPTPAG